MIRDADVSISLGMYICQYIQGLTVYDLFENGELEVGHLITVNTVTPLKQGKFIVDMLLHTTICVALDCHIHWWQGCRRACSLIAVAAWVLML
jgi:hypothetical protein